MMARRKRAPRVWRRTRFRSRRVNYSRVVMVVTTPDFRVGRNWLLERFMAANPGVAQVVPRDTIRSMWNLTDREEGWL